jgi:propionyl-CoA synthetase
LFLAGERADPPTVHWAQDIIKRPVIDNYWMTETGWPVTSNFAGLGLFPIKVGSGGKPVPGYDVTVLNDEGHPVDRGTQGNVVVKLPLPPGNNSYYFY